jgi:Triosephosphate isomerase
MPKSFVIGNWKLNPTKAEAVALLAALESGARARQTMR